MPEKQSKFCEQSFISRKIFIYVYLSSKLLNTWSALPVIRNHLFYSYILPPISADIVDYKISTVRNCSNFFIVACMFPSRCSWLLHFCLWSEKDKACSHWQFLTVLSTFLGHIRWRKKKIKWCFLGVIFSNSTVLYIAEPYSLFIFSKKPERKTSRRKTRFWLAPIRHGL